MIITNGVSAEAAAPFNRRAEFSLFTFFHVRLYETNHRLVIFKGHFTKFLRPAHQGFEGGRILFRHAQKGEFYFVLHRLRQPGRHRKWVGRQARGLPDNSVLPRFDHSFCLHTTHVGFFIIGPPGRNRIKISFIEHFHAVFMTP